MPEIKFPSKEIIICAFLGGIVVPLLELMNMFVSRENVLDPYFYGGMLIAGVIGIIGLLVSQVKDIGGAIAAGIAAPQVLGSLTKVGPTVVALLTAPIGTAYAQGDTIPVLDSLEITTIVEGTYKVLEIKPLNSRRGILLRDTTVVKVPAGDSLEIIGEGDAVHFYLDKNTGNKKITIKIKVREQIVQQEQSSLNRMFRGVFGNSHRKEPAIIQRLELSIEEKPIEKDE